MRLLNVRTIRLHEFYGDSVPKYAIASHRWADQEALFHDVQEGGNLDSVGFRKVTGFCQYIAKHIPDIEWLWIDTCCIDKQSSQELSEAINSMFRWYSQAEVCLAYLTDVSTPEIEDFIQSEWFTRGWTLQELLAPTIVVFLTSDWQVIGHKGQNAKADDRSPLDVGRSLARTVSIVTKIPEAVLRDYEQSKNIDDSDKFNWMAGRRTTREEDMSYCLFGIFDVAIGSNYGEGGERARRRLLKDISEKSFYNSPASRPFTRAPSSSHVTRMKPDMEARPDHLLHQKLKESLFFPQMGHRRAQIRSAFQGTYQWALLSTTSTNTRWDNFVTWLSDPRPEHRIYWINAKPGAGKSSLVRFLDEELRIDCHMQPWAANVSVMRVHHYIWSPGSPLQKSLEGLLRNLLHQLLEQSPELMIPCFPPCIRLAGEPAHSANSTSWTIMELQECLRKFISASAQSAKILFLLDGLDEIHGHEDSRDEVIELVRELATSPNVKLCVSSRRWPVFEDAFTRCPQLRLEDLNAHDIEIYVRGLLMAQERYRQMLTYDPPSARLVYDIISKAKGVFLWIRLVVKELLRGLRDGDSYQTLHAKLHNMPEDLNDYFSRLVESIEPYHRREACILLQIALFEETEFITFHPLRLLDLIFIQDADENFSLTGVKEVYVKNFKNATQLLYRLDSTLRRLSSLCKGLLECFFEARSTLNDFVVEEEMPGEEIVDQWEDTMWDRSTYSPRTVTSLPQTLIPVFAQHKYAAADFRVDFMHRSLRDYLLEPERIQFLTQYTGGPFDTRKYLRNARLVEICMATSENLKAEVIVGLASYFLSTLSVPSFRSHPDCSHFAVAFQPLAQYAYVGASSEAADFWYICRSMESWALEHSNFITLAIDFGLTGYLAQSLTIDAIRSKKGRPILDYILRPRFASMLTSSSTCVGLQYPDPDLVRHVLSLGADPNGAFEGTSIWPLFLSFIVVYDAMYKKSRGHLARIEKARTGYLISLEAMIRAGADVVITRSSLSAGSDHGVFTTTSEEQFDPFLYRWPDLARMEHSRTGFVGQFALSDILECLRRIFGEKIDTLKTMAERRAMSQWGHTHGS